MKRLYIIFFLILFPAIAQAQVTSQATTGIPAPTLHGNGSPDNNYLCTPVLTSHFYFQDDVAVSRQWMCNGSSWIHLLNPVMGVASSGSITGGTYLLGGCTVTATVAVPGATIGVNTATASPIFATAPLTNIGLFNLTAWVSAANTVSVQGCAVGTVTVPNFTAKVLLY